MSPIHHHKIIVLKFAYLHVHPGGGIEKTILLTPSFQRFLDSTARQHIVELLDFIDAHVAHSTRNRQGFDDWIFEKPNEYEEREYDKWTSALTPIPRPNGWEEVETSNG